MSTLTPAQKVAAYIKLRDYKKAADKAYEASMQRTYQAMEKLENELLNDLNTSGANSLACDDGTVYRNIQTSATVENREVFREYVQANDLWEAVDFRANKTFVKEFMERNGTPIPGVKVTQVATVGVRRS